MSPADHYQALGLPRDASSEQIEKAYAFFSAMYAERAVATYSLLDPDEMQQTRARIQAAYEVLRDPVRRGAYDALASGEAPRSAGPATPAPSAPPRAPETAAVPPPAPAHPRFLPEPVTGASLRRAREERGIALRDIAVATKIGVRFLEYIEADRHKDLPARVYLRGFIQQYAQFLGLDPGRTAESYLRRVSRSQS